MTEVKRLKMRRVDVNVAEFLDGIGTLSPEEIGVYWVVCLMIYDAGGPIDDDAAAIARRMGKGNARGTRRVLEQLVESGKLTRHTAAEWAKLEGRPMAESAKPESSLASHWGKDSPNLKAELPKLSNRRCLEEIKRAVERIEIGRQFGKTGGRPPKETAASSNPGGFVPQKGDGYAPENPRARDSTSTSKDSIDRYARGEKGSGLLGRLVAALDGKVESGPGITDTSPIEQAIAQGASLEADVLPTLADIASALRQPLRTWRAQFVLDAIAAARAERLRNAGVADLDEAARERTWRAALRAWAIGAIHDWDERNWGPSPFEPARCRIPAALVEEVLAENGTNLRKLAEAKRWNLTTRAAED